MPTAASVREPGQSSQLFPCGHIHAKLSLSFCISDSHKAGGVSVRNRDSVCLQSIFDPSYAAVTVHPASIVASEHFNI